MTSRLTITLPDPDETEPKRWLCNAGNIEFEPAVSNEGEATIWLRDQALAPDDAFELAVSLLACWTHRDGLAKQEAAENDEVTADEAVFGAAYGKATKRKAERAVVAVLRGLAESYDGRPIYYQDLRALADSIEKGGEANG